MRLCLSRHRHLLPILCQSQLQLWRPLGQLSRASRTTTTAGQAGRTWETSSLTSHPAGCWLLQVRSPAAHLGFSIVHSMACLLRSMYLSGSSALRADSDILTVGVAISKSVLLCRWWFSTEAWLTWQGELAYIRSSLVVVAPCFNFNRVSLL